MKIFIEFSDFSKSGYNSIEEAERAILDAHAAGASIKYIMDDEGHLYSCEWSVKLQRES